MTKKICKTTN